MWEEKPVTERMNKVSLFFFSYVTLSLHEGLGNEIENEV